MGFADFLDRVLAVPRREVRVRGTDLAALLRGSLADPDEAAALVRTFESEFAAYLGASRAVAVASGRLGLRLILEELKDDGPNEVILPAYTDESVPGAIVAAGLTPVFVDVNFPDGNISLARVREKIGSRTLAVVATHLFGRPCDVDACGELCAAHGAHLVEDCAHSLGAEYRDRKVGTFGSAAFFSFAETKPFTTFGGGMVVTGSEELAKGVRQRVAGFPQPGAGRTARTLAKTLLLHGVTRRSAFTLSAYPLLRLLNLFGEDLIGAYGRLVKPLGVPGKGEVAFTAGRAAVGLEALNRLPGELARRGECARSLGAPADDEEARAAHYFFVITDEECEKLACVLLTAGVDTGKRLMRNTARLFGDEGSYPVTERLLRESIQLPIHEGLSSARTRRTADILRRRLLAATATEGG